jgi:hypothetical protein
MTSDVVHVDAFAQLLFTHYLQSIQFVPIYRDKQILHHRVAVSFPVTGRRQRIRIEAVKKHLKDGRLHVIDLYMLRSIIVVHRGTKELSIENRRPGG